MSMEEILIQKVSRVGVLVHHPAFKYGVIVIFLLLYGCIAFVLGFNTAQFREQSTLQTSPQAPDFYQEDASSQKPDADQVTMDTVAPVQLQPTILRSGEKYTFAPYQLTMIAPIDMLVVESGIDSGLILQHETVEAFSISIVREENSDNYDLEKFVQERICNQFGNDVPEHLGDFQQFCMQQFLETKSDFSVSGITGIRFKHNPYELMSDYIIFEQNGYVYSVITSPTAAGGVVPEIGLDSAMELVRTMKFAQ